MEHIGLITNKLYRNHGNRQLWLRCLTSIILDLKRFWRHLQTKLHSNNWNRWFRRHCRVAVSQSKGVIGGNFVLIQTVFGKSTFSQRRSWTSKAFVCYAV